MTKKYDKEFKLQTVRLIQEEGKAMRDLQKGIRDLEEENEILKKAMHYFAKDRADLSIYS
ncbi:hypothetical protein M3650_13445 [Paenibacillus sp. MER TA 81-3]|uniref:hypothetical protein n=1 Tax=Paenibacillus sp. MER TA 81-3 TaxID=2939573 RepID=UPI00203C7960|nr:hypothetical protein [Paenibacillus sp. MER TA 81-3]MCM3339600.1 hypothetical protein [Paenibacillus sp. MER TA 81-3]